MDPAQGLLNALKMKNNCRYSILVSPYPFCQKYKWCNDNAKEDICGILKKFFTRNIYCSGWIGFPKNLVEVEVNPKENVGHKKRDK